MLTKKMCRSSYPIYIYIYISRIYYHNYHHLILSNIYIYISRIYYHLINWLVVWNIFPYIGNFMEFHHPNWQTHIVQRDRAQPAINMIILSNICLESIIVIMIILYYPIYIQLIYNNLLDNINHISDIISNNILD